VKVTLDGGVNTIENLVTVLNVAPVTRINSVTDETGVEIGEDASHTFVGRTITLAGDFTDAGTKDTHTATIDWGDGTVDDLGNVSDIINGDHVYNQDGEYLINLTVADDDGGEGKAFRAIKVLSVLTCDFNYDCVVDGLDFIMFRNEWGVTDCVNVGCACDMNEDGKVDGLDFITFRNNWGKTCP
jgi:hypothetical protein